MNISIKIEKTLFYFLTFAFFWQLRLVWTSAEQQFNEWASFYLYATDLIVVAILVLWGIRMWTRLNFNPPVPPFTRGVNKKESFEFE